MKTLKIGDIEYKQITEERKLSESEPIGKSPASREDLIALDDKLRDVQKTVEDFKKDVPDATNSIGQIMNRLEKMECAIEEMQDVMMEVMPSAHDHAEGEGLSTEMKFAVLDFLKEVDGLPATDDEFATNPDGTVKREKKKDVRNLTAQGAEVDPNIDDPEELKVLELERKVDALMKTPLYRGADYEKVTTQGDYLGSVISSQFKGGN